MEPSGQDLHSVLPIELLKLERGQVKQEVMEGEEVYLPLLHFTHELLEYKYCPAGQKTVPWHGADVYSKIATRSPQSFCMGHNLEE